MSICRRCKSTHYPRVEPETLFYLCVDCFCLYTKLKMLFIRKFLKTEEKVGAFQNLTITWDFSVDAATYVQETDLSVGYQGQKLGNYKLELPEE